MVNGYDILFVQAAYQYMEWFDDTINFEYIFIKYQKAMDLFLKEKLKQR